jgi:hypothetical protein
VVVVGRVVVVVARVVLVVDPTVVGGDVVDVLEVEDVGGGAPPPAT